MNFQILVFYAVTFEAMFGTVPFLYPTGSFITTQSLYFPSTFKMIPKLTIITLIRFAHTSLQLGHVLSLIFVTIIIH